MSNAREPAGGVFNKEWELKRYDEEAVRALSAELNLPKTIIKLLLSKGVGEAEEIREFLNPKLRTLHNPFTFKDMEKAVARIRKAVDTGEKILVYGDRDMDGITAVSIMVSTLKILGADVLWHLSRDDGYGVSSKALTEYVKQGVKLVVTVDCGITANREISELAAAGIDTIVTDHHQTQGDMPNAYALLNPHIASCGYPFKELAGCGVSLKVMQALMYSFAADYGKNAVVVRFVGEKVKMFVVRNCVKISDESELSAQNTSMLDSADFFIFFDVLRYEKTAREYPEIFEKHIKKKEAVFLDERFPAAKLVKNGGTDSLTAAQMLEIYYYGEFFYDLRMRHYIYQTLDLAALGTIADLVSLKGENRVIVNTGVKLLESTRNLGLKKLFFDLNIKLKEYILGTKELSWKVIPLLNSCGRCANPEMAVEFLLADSEEKAGKFVEKIVNLNNERKLLQEKNKKAFQSRLDRDYRESDKFIFLSADNIDHGVTGIVANHFLKKHKKPVFLIIKQGESLHGASRSPKDMPVLPFLEKCADILDSYGGHPCAAGFRLNAANLEKFRQRLTELAEKPDGLRDAVSKIVIDAVFEPEDFNMEFIDSMKLLEPFGSDNAEPVFLLKGVKINGIEKMGAEKNHLRFKLDANGHKVNALGWDFGDYAQLFSSGSQFDLVFSLEGDNYGKNKNFRIVVNDFALAKEAVLIN